MPGIEGVAIGTIGGKPWVLAGMAVSNARRATADRVIAATLMVALSCGFIGVALDKLRRVVIVGLRTKC